MTSRHVNFGLWYDFRNPPPSAVSFEALYRASLEQISWAETLGLRLGVADGASLLR